MKSDIAARFRDQGFSDYLIKALIADGYADPRRLLTASWREILLIPNVGVIGLAQIEAYRARTASRLRIANLNREAASLALHQGQPSWATTPTLMCKPLCWCRRALCGTTWLLPFVN